MRDKLAYISALLTSLFLAVGGILPTKARRGVAQWVTIVIVLIIIVAGVAVIATLVLFPGGVSTATYP